MPDVKEPGTYGSTLVIVSNDPDKSLLMVPISMTVSSPIYGLALAPSADAQTANPGSTVTYTLRLTNTGNIIDNFSVTLSEYNWPTIASVTAGPLPPSYDTNIGVIVQVPPDAPEGASDTATVVIYSQGDNGQSVSAALTTTALAAPSDSHVLLLPLIMKQ